MDADKDKTKGVEVSEEIQKIRYVTTQILS